jgi:unsaturated rhamnogalacturonyl hydrolase
MENYSKDCSVIKISSVRYVTILFLFLFFIQGNCQVPGLNRVVVSVKRNNTVPNTEQAQLVFDWSALKKINSHLELPQILVTDQHFGTKINFMTIDSNKDGVPDGLTFDYAFASSEPVFAFMVSNGGPGPTGKKENVTPDPKFKFDYLLPYPMASMKSEKSFADKIVESTIRTYPDTKDLSIISPGKWTYEYGFFLNATYQLYQQTKNEKYFNYIKSWLDNFIAEDGQWKPGASYDMKEYRLDDILPGRLCISLYQKTGEKKYKVIADQFITHLTQQPRTSEGGYWHKEIYPNQMWLDGIYMGDIFSMQYAAAFNQPQWFEESVLQIDLMYKHAYDPVSGVLFHGWDESKNKIWADQEKGNSPELWSRAIGWYAMALIECLDYLPSNHLQRKSIEDRFKKLCASIVKFRDKESGLWYQIIDKGDRKDNWIETSGSAMFTYAFAKGYSKGLLDKSFKAAADKAFDSILFNYIYVDKDNEIHLDQAVKVGSLNFKNSKGDYPYYVTCERRLDDYKGLAALLYASLELKR